MIIDEQEKFIAKSSGRKERTVESEDVSRTFCICQPRSFRTHHHDH